MIRFSIVCICILCIIQEKVNASYYNTVSIDGFNIKLSKEPKGIFLVENNKDKTTKSCKIKGWNDTLSKNGGVISLTNDGIGLIVNSYGGYIDINELLDCKSNIIGLRKITYYNDQLSKLIDVNFKNKVVLALIVIDAQLSKYQAIVSRFDGEHNVLQGKGFWDNKQPSVPGEDDVFYVGDDYFAGGISLNGVYISPVSLDCSSNSFPGVWDIKKKKKVIFDNDGGSLSVDNKCKILFSGERTLKELNGKLIH